MSVVFCVYRRVETGGGGYKLICEELHLSVIHTRMHTLVLSMSAVGRSCKELASYMEGSKFQDRPRHLRPREVSLLVSDIEAVWQRWYAAMYVHTYGTSTMDACGVVMSRDVGSQDQCCRLAVTRRRNGRLAERETPADTSAARSCAYVSLYRCSL